MEREMQRLLSSLVLLLTSTLAYAQQSVPSVPSAEEAGTRGDAWLFPLIAIAVVVVAIGVYFFIRRGGRVRM
ncbi:hypothetical protein AA309_15700 [Microvirga vignae]|uniref:Uncharacterized protein n=2 Tax=Microvirga vignae TaxID=1225564 RepID=A0A0H1RAU3_9HYPH|nr:hypothetical protein AA309_15700 [Microvirga vignae]